MFLYNPLLVFFNAQKIEQALLSNTETGFITLFPSLIFLIGLFGLLLNRRNLISVLLSLELVLLGANLNFILISVGQVTPMGQVFSLLILTVAAAESALGLGILIVLFRLQHDVSFEKFAHLRG